MALLKNPTPDNQSEIVLTYDHAAVVETDLTVQLFKVPAGKKLKIDSVDYINPTGLAAHADNFFFLSVNNGADKAAGWLTDDDATTTGINGGADEGSIPADEFVAFTLNSDKTKLIFEAGEVLSLVLDESGTQTLPAGRLIVHARYL